MATKRELKKIVKIHCAAVLLAAESIVAFEDTNLTIDDFAYMSKEIDKTALKLLGDNKLMYSATEIVEYVCGCN